ncbi:MAG: YitT family protein [Rikenellaceae bacterium]|nr:YitT family protein [Rikenellaceae bacterium]
MRSYAIITLGLLIYSFSWTNILVSANVMGGSSGGIAMLIYYLTGGENGGIPIGISYLLINAILVTTAMFIIGPKFGIKTIYAMLVISGLMTVMQLYLPPNLLGLADDKLLSAILGGGLAGIGIAIIFMQGGSSGGTDIIAMIVNKYRNISYGRILMLCDVIILGISVLIFKNITALIYGYVVVGVFGLTLDFIIAGNKQFSEIMIVSRH